MHPRDCMVGLLHCRLCPSCEMKQCKLQGYDWELLDLVFLFHRPYYDNYSDLPTHPLFAGDTRILQGSPAHLRRIASHPHLARLHKRCLSVNLFHWSSQPLDHEDKAIPYSGNFGGRKLGELMKNTIFAEKVRTDCSLLSRQGCHTPKFREKKKFRKEPQNHKFAKVSRHPRLKFSIYTLFARVPVRQTFDFVSLVPKPLGKRL